MGIRELAMIAFPKEKTAAALRRPHVQSLLQGAGDVNPPEPPAAPFAGRRGCALEALG
jgi:hypothetical protein